MNKIEKYVTKYLARINEKGSTYLLNVRQPWYDLIKSGDKTVEGRLNKGIFSQLKAGDSIEWSESKDPNSEKFRVIISYVTKYDSFKEMLEAEGISNVLPIYYVTNVEDGIRIYRQFYDEENEKKFGVLAIGMVAIK